MNTPNIDKKHRTSFWLRAIELRKHELSHEYRKGLGKQAREGISDEDYATTVATLEKMARNLGWDESQRDHGPRRRHFGHPAMMRGHGFGPKHHHPLHDEAPEA